MRLDLDTEIRYPEGERAGVLRKVVLDENNDVAGVVMATTGLISRNVLVPVGLLREDYGGVLTIAATNEEVDALEDYGEEMVPVVHEWDEEPNYALGEEVFPATLMEPIMPVVEVPTLDEGAVSISQGTAVTCLDGRWGIVDEVVVGDNGRATAFVGRPDAIDESDRIIPMALVQEFDTERVVLNCTIADLPTYTQEMVGETEEPELE